EVTDLPAGRHQVQAFATLANGEVRVSPVVGFRLAPVNDAFTNATLLVGRQVTNDVVFSGGSFEEGEPAGANASSATVWYQWVAPATGTLTVRNAGGAEQVLTGPTLASLYPVATVAGPPPGYTVTAGIRYFIRLSFPIPPVGKNLGTQLRLALSTASLAAPQENVLLPAGEPVPVTLTTTAAASTVAAIRFRVDDDPVPLAVLTKPPWKTAWTNATPGIHSLVAQLDFVDGGRETTPARSFVVAPANDRFTHAVPLEGVAGQVIGQSRGATPDLGGAGIGEVWFRWTSPGDGLFQVQTTALQGLAEVRLHTGTNLASLVRHPVRTNAQGQPRPNEWRVRPGVAYHVAVLQSAPATLGGAFDLRWTFLPAATNDAWAHRQTLEGESGVASGSLSLATLEPGEPAYGSDYPVAASVWWTWTPPRSGLLRLSFPDDNAPPNTVRPFLGEALGALQPVPAVGHPWVGGPRPQYHRVAAGVPVHLAYVASQDNLAERRFRWELLPLPENDAFADRRVIGPAERSVPGTTLGAQVSSADPFSPDPRVGDVWWTWVAPADGDLVLGLRGLRGPQVLTLYQGAMAPALTWLRSQYASLDHPFGNPVPVVAGQTYQVMVGSPELPGEVFQLEIQLRTRPANDDFAGRERVEGPVARLAGANWRAGQEFREPAHAGRFGGRSVWFAWRAPAEGRVTLRPVGGELPWVLAAVYTGESVEALQPVAA
ncbi:MAG: Ig-like domain-containing protein, partial [Verrucomicrobiota bacterium]